MAQGSDSVLHGRPSGAPRWPAGLVGTALAGAAATLLLCLGLYAWLRPAGSAYLLPASLTHPIHASPMWRAVTGSVPSFAHAFALGVVTALLLPPRRRWIWLACGAWGLVDAALELAQMPRLATTIAAALPAAFDQVPVLDHLGRYLVNGTFDAFDVMAAFAGACAAGLLLTRMLRSHERTRIAVPRDPHQRRNEE